MVRRLVTGILTVVLLPLGLVFLVIGLAVDEPDSGRPEDFLYVGAALTLAGLVLGVASLALWRREAARRRRRRAGLRTTAEVVQATWRPYVQVGSALTFHLTVRFAADPGEVTASRTVLVGRGSTLTEGASVEILYDPEDPSNFELARPDAA